MSISRFIYKISGTVINILLNKLKDDSVTDSFERSVKKNPDKTMIIFVQGNGHSKMTFKEVDNLANQYSHFFDHTGFVKGDVVAMFSENRIIFNSVWIGLAKLGVITAQININLRNEALIHTLTVSKCKGIIFTQELEPGMESQLPVHGVHVCQL